MVAVTLHGRAADDKTSSYVAASDDVGKSKGGRNSSSSPPQPQRYDIVLWLFGLLFIFVMGCLIFGIGESRGWDADSPYTYNKSNTTIERFLPKPFVPEPGVYKRSDPQASSRWYYWKLRPSLVTIDTKLFVWTCYTLHILSAWLVLYLLQKSKTFPNRQDEKYTSTPSKYNVIMFTVNAFFHVLHLIITHTTYDGMAADVSEASSQSSVVVALILILFVEVTERGVFFGYPTQSQLGPYLSSIWMAPVYLIKKFHGYFIYWAVIFTFWYHPMENTPGHILGFTYTWFFMLQGSLAFQAIHFNTYWKILLEMWVTMHASLVAYQTVPDIMGKQLWPMFLFGFLAVFVLTQLYGLPLWKYLPTWCRAIPAVMYLAVTVTAYSFLKDTHGRPYTRITEIFRIPGTYYLLLAIGWLVIVGLTKAFSTMRTKLKNDTDVKVQMPTRKKEVLILGSVIIIYIISVFLSWYLEYLDIPWNMLVFTIIFSIFFLLVPAIVGSMLLKTILPVSSFE